MSSEKFFEELHKPPRTPWSESFGSIVQTLRTIADHVAASGTKEIRATKVDFRIVAGVPKLIVRLDSGDVLIVRTHEIAAKNLTAQLVSGFKA